MNKEIRKKFEEVAIKHNKMRLYHYTDALKLIDECEKQKVKILGFDSFKLFPDNKIQPFMEFSPDYSNMEISLTWDKARKDINICYQNNNQFIYEIVY